MVDPRLLTPLAVALLLAACGGGGSGDESGSPDGPGVQQDDTGVTDPSDVPPVVVPERPDAPEVPEAIEPPEPDTLPPDADSASYSVTIESFWFAEDYPQDFPDDRPEEGDAHLSYIGGATHNAAVSFWEPGGFASEGMEDLAETGRVSILFEEEVDPAIEAGTAGSRIEFLDYTFSSPTTFALGLINENTFPIEMVREWPLVTLVTMLGPSPDWFVGVDGLPLHEAGAWRDEVVVDLPLYDGGSKSTVQPFLGGPDTDPQEPIALIAYDDTSGTYLPSETPQNLARLSFIRTR